MSSVYKHFGGPNHSQVFYAANLEFERLTTLLENLWGRVACPYWANPRIGGSGWSWRHPSFIAWGSAHQVPGVQEARWEFHVVPHQPFPQLIIVSQWFHRKNCQKLYEESYLLHMHITFSYLSLLKSWGVIYHSLQTTKTNLTIFFLKFSSMGLTSRLYVGLDQTSMAQYSN